VCCAVAKAAVSICDDLQKMDPIRAGNGREKERERERESHKEKAKIFNAAVVEFVSRCSGFW